MEGAGWRRQRGTKTGEGRRRLSGGREVSSGKWQGSGGGLWYVQSGVKTFLPGFGNGWLKYCAMVQFWCGQGVIQPICNNVASLCTWRGKRITVQGPCLLEYIVCCLTLQSQWQNKTQAPLRSHSCADRHAGDRGENTIRNTINGWGII